MFPLLNSGSSFSQVIDQYGRKIHLYIGMNCLACWNIVLYQACPHTMSPLNWKIKYLDAWWNISRCQLWLLLNISLEESYKIYNNDPLRVNGNGIIKNVCTRQQIENNKIITQSQSQRSLLYHHIQPYYEKSCNPFTFDRIFQQMYAIFYRKKGEKYPYTHEWM